jgi:hypothetical protein
MHPFEDTFAISDGNVAFVFRMEFEPEIMEIFDK